MKSVKSTKERYKGSNFSPKQILGLEFVAPLSFVPTVRKFVNLS